MTPLRAVPLEHQLSAPDRMPPSPPRQAICVVPGCRVRARHRHHIVKREEAGDFIIIDNIYLVQNVADCCVDHHLGVESQPGGVNYRIRWLGEAGWGWYRRLTGSTDHAIIMWFDQKTKTPWQFLGFLKGEWVTKIG